MHKIAWSQFRYLFKKRGFRKRYEVVMVYPEGTESVCVNFWRLRTTKAYYGIAIAERLAPWIMLADLFLCAEPWEDGTTPWPWIMESWVEPDEPKALNGLSIVPPRRPIS
jgi:hypothetical protein